MAQDEDEKSVQKIKDVSDRKKAYYSSQRESAEKGAAKGDRSSAGQANKIYAKLGNADKSNYYGTEKMIGKGGADFFDKLGKVEKIGIPLAAPEARGAGAAASIARGLVPRAAKGAKEGLAELGNKASQWLGKAKPVAKALEGGPRKLAGGTQKALTGGKDASKASDGVYNLRDGGTTKKALTGAKSGEQKALGTPKGAGNAKSSPMKRATANSMRYNPQSGKMVGKSPMRIQSDATIRQGKKAQMAETAEMNKTAAGQNPRSRAMRSNEALGKPGSGKKGSYESATDKLRKARPHVSGPKEDSQDAKSKTKAKSASSGGYSDPGQKQRLAKQLAEDRKTLAEVRAQRKANT